MIEMCYVLKQRFLWLVILEHEGDYLVSIICDFTFRLYMIYELCHSVSPRTIIIF